MLPVNQNTALLFEEELLSFLKEGGNKINDEWYTTDAVWRAIQFEDEQYRKALFVVLFPTENIIALNQQAQGIWRSWHSKINEETKTLLILKFQWGTLHDNHQ